jgi:RimJ/RimL family protein N-acetyltransferase
MRRIETERLHLSPLQPGDSADIQRLAGDVAVARTALGIPHPFHDGMAEAWIEGLGTDDAIFSIREGAGAPLVGLVGLQRVSSGDVAELSYWLGKPYWGLGYATEAASSVVAFGFEQMGLRRVFATSLASNPASGHVLEKLGMREEGLLRQHVTHWGRHEDLRFHGLLRWEHDAMKGAVEDEPGLPN